MKSKKKCLCCVAMLLMIAFSGLAVHADEVPAKISTTDNEAIYTPRKEETEWYFRENPQTGVLEKRLWSNTYGKWKTDWEPVF